MSANLELSVCERCGGAVALALSGDVCERCALAALRRVAEAAARFREAVLDRRYAERQLDETGDPADAVIVRRKIDAYETADAELVAAIDAAREVGRD